jgi:hypothetical protein
VIIIEVAIKKFHAIYNKLVAFCTFLTKLFYDEQYNEGDDSRIVEEFQVYLDNV